MAKKGWTIIVSLVLMLTTALAWAADDETGGKHEKHPTVSIQPDKKIIRCAIIGGMTMTKLWDEIAKRFEAKTGYRVKVVATGPRPVLNKAFREGKADFLTMHSGDITTLLVTDGYGTNMRAWTKNDLVVLGPPSDPAGIRGMKSGVEAFRKIAQTQSPFLDALDIGSREVCHTLWKKAGFKPTGSWIIRDDSPTPTEIITFAEKQNAYVVFGRMPVLFHKVAFGKMEIMVESDPQMRRPYIVMEANPKRLPDANVEGAHALSEFLFSDEIQTLLSEYGTKEYGGIPLFHPIWPREKTDS